MKKFEIGLSPEIPAEDYYEILDRYSEYIDYVFFTIPDAVYQSRRSLYTTMTQEKADEFLKKAIDIFKEYNIKLQLCLNVYWLTEINIKAAKDYCIEKLGIMPDAIVCLERYTDLVVKYFPDAYMIYSYNNGTRLPRVIENIPSVYKEVVLSPQPLGLNNLAKIAKEKGLKVRFMLNNGCSFNCKTCENSSSFCKPTFNRNLQHFGLDKFYSFASIFPCELHEFLESNPNIDAYKISSRPCTTEYLMECLDYYVNNKPIKTEDFSKVYPLFCKLSWWNLYAKEYNIDNILQIKKENNYVNN